MHAFTAVRAHFSGGSGFGIVLLAAILAHGCADRATETVRLQLQLDPSVLAGGTGTAPGQLGFYVAGLRLVTARGDAVPVRLDEKPTQSQAEGVALVVWSGDCAQSANVAAKSAEVCNSVVTGQVPSARYQALGFELGVPFERNHANPLTAPAPLNVASMFWTWQTGYKFLRLDLGTDWSFHLGSTGCIAESAVRPPESCRQPNRATIRLPAAAAFEGVVVVDLARLLTGLDTALAENCVEAYGKRGECRQLLTRLGIDADTGRCIDHCVGQTLFLYESASRPAQARAHRERH